MWDSIIDPVASLLGQDADSQRDRLGTDAGGKYKPTFGDHFWGRANEGQGVLDTVKQKKITDTYKPQILRYGGTWNDNYSEGEAAAELGDAKIQYDIKNDKTRSDADFYSTANVETRRINNERYLDERRDAAQDRLDLREREMRLERKDDRRHNERLQLEAKKDRRLAMQSLAQGIASLGAAFAL